MRDLARSAMLDGAFGLSTGLFYVPGNYAPTEEVIEIAKVVGALGGMHISHMRDEAAARARQCARNDSHRRRRKLTDAGHASQDHWRQRWGKSVETLKLIEEARARGCRCVVGSVSVHGFAHRFGGDVSSVVARRWSERAARAIASSRIPGPDQDRSRSADSRRSRGRRSQERSVQSVRFRSVAEWQDAGGCNCSAGTAGNDRERGRSCARLTEARRLLDDLSRHFGGGCRAHHEIPGHDDRH